MMQKRIAILTYYFSPEITAASSRIEVLAESLAKKYSVTVFCPRKNRKGKVGSVDVGYDVVRCLYVRYNQSNFVIRTFGELVNCILLIITLLRRGAYDRYVITVPSMFLLFLSIFLPKDKVIIDVRDLVWRYLEKTGGGYVGKAFFWISRKCLGRINKISVTNQFEKDYMDQLFNKKKDVRLFSNGLSREKYRLLSSIKRKKEVVGQIKILYVGNIGVAQRIEEMLPYFVGKEDYRFDVVGGGASVSCLLGVLSSYGGSNIVYHGIKKWSELYSYYEEADVLLIKLSVGYESALPSKVYEAFAINRPVLVVGEGELVRFCEGFANSVVIPASDLSVLSEKLDGLGEMLGVDYSGTQKIISENYIREDLFEQFGEWCVE